MATTLESPTSRVYTPQSPVLMAAETSPNYEPPSPTFQSSGLSAGTSGDDLAYVPLLSGYSPWNLHTSRYSVNASSPKYVVESPTISPWSSREPRPRDRAPYQQISPSLAPTPSSSLTSATLGDTTTPASQSSRQYSLRSRPGLYSRAHNSSSQSTRSELTHRNSTEGRRIPDGACQQGRKHGRQSDDMLAYPAPKKVKPHKPRTVSHGRLTPPQLQYRAPLRSASSKAQLPGIRDVLPEYFGSGSEPSNQPAVTLPGTRDLFPETFKRERSLLVPVERPAALGGYAPDVKPAWSARQEVKEEWRLQAAGPVPEAGRMGSGGRDGMEIRGEPEVISPLII